MSALPLGRYRELLDQLLQLNEQTAALRRELGAWVDTGASSEQPEDIGSSEVDGGVSSPLAPSGFVQRQVADTLSNMESFNSGLADRIKQSLNGNSEDVLSESFIVDDNFVKNTPSTSAANAECARVTQHHREVHNARTKIYSNPVSETKSPSTPNSLDSTKKSRPPRKNSCESIQTELIDGENEFCTIPRKPHFLDDDYHLKSSDVCRIPKPHFLDHSPSPDEDRAIDINDPHLLNDDTSGSGSWDKSLNKNCDPVKYQNLKHSLRSRNFKDMYIDDSNFIDRSTLKGNSTSNGDMMSSQSSSSSNRYCPQVNDNNWPTEKDLWHNQDSCSVKSFSSAGSGNAPHMVGLTQSHLGSKVDCVYSLLSLLSISADNNADMSEYLLKMSQSIESCIAMRQSGCIPLLVQLINSKHTYASREKAAQALHNLIHAQPDDKAGRREVRVLRLLEQVREYCHILENILLKKDQNISLEDDMEKHPTQSVAALMKLSFDEEHRHVMCQLGGLQALATLVTVDQTAHGSVIEDIQCVTMRKYSGMALTNLTFGDGNNKALLCSFKDFMTSLVDQLQSPNDDMRQVTAAVLRNLSWRADSASKQILREVGAVKGLTVAAMTGRKEATLKSVLSALWNLTAHCSLNKVEICSVDGALAFLVDMLSFDAPSKTLAIIENAGGILRNVSSHIAVREEYRQILREHSCLKVLLQQLKSPSLTIVSNSCGTLWNLSARCQQDQQFLWDHGAIPMLRSLIHSKHKMISMGSSAALKNLLNSKPGKNHITSLDSTTRDLNLPMLPTLGARKQKALEHEIDQNLAETCENIEPATSPTTNNRDEKLLLTAAERHLALNMEKRRMTSSSPLMSHLPSQISLNHSSHYNNYMSCGNSLLQGGIQKGHTSRPIRHGNVNRSDSKDSVTSTHSDSVYERVSRNNKIPNFSKQTSEQINDKNTGSCNSVHSLTSKTDNNFIKRYSKSGALMKYEHINNIPSISNEMSRNNYSESGYDMEQDCCDQPIDYSQKYSETKSSHNTICENTEENFSLSNNFQNLKEEDSVSEHSINSLLINLDLNVHNDKIPTKINPSVSFGDYQETDLDQPTDYSLRYAEDQSEVGSNLSEAQVPSVHEDTIKHFCTEGTPYETPINFSTATSMSDLRAIGSAQPLCDKSFPKTKVKIEPNSCIVTKESSEMSHSDEKDICSLEDPTKHDNDEVVTNSKLTENIIQPTTSNILKYDSKFSSGILSPDKPVNYCEEGTPGYFSRVSSLSSLEEIEGGITDVDVKWEDRKDESLNGHFTPPISNNIASVENEKEKEECKNTHLESNSVLNYSEETPLMFSRCSSLGSLSECSVPDQPDDVGSVVSEFSRMTSGCISPSELPDSPTQSPPPKLETSNASALFNKPIKHFKLANQPTNRLHSVFEDEVSTFKFEHTPIEFSTGTSLSSLTIDDEPTGKVSLSILLNSVKRSEGVGCSNPIEIPRSQPIMNNENSLAENINQSCKSNVSSEQESEEILAACIDAGVQSRLKTRIPNVPARTSVPDNGKKFVESSNSAKSGQDCEEILAACIDAGVQSRIKTRLPNSLGRPCITTQNDLMNKSSDIQDNCLPSDTCHTYYTEDTPLLSKVGSQSDLSVLSINESDVSTNCSPVASNISKKNTTMSDKKDYSDDSSNLSDVSENLLAECIRSGMPKSALPSYLIPQDEVENYAIEGSPFQPSLNSSLSDLTIASDKTNSKAQLLQRNISMPIPPINKQSLQNRFLSIDQYKTSSHRSPTGSLSSVSLGSDDGHILDMAIRAGVPREKDGSRIYSNDKSKEFIKKEPKPHNSSSYCTFDDKSEEHVTVLTRNDSLSSLSVDSLGSNEGEQAILEQCIKSGMPKARPNRKWEDGKSDLSKYQSEIQPLEKQRSVQNAEFGNPVIAFSNCAKTKTERDDFALLEEVIYCGLPKRKNKIDNGSKESGTSTSKAVNNSEGANSSFSVGDIEREINMNFPKNVQVTSVVASNGLNATCQNVNIVQAASDVKTLITAEIIFEGKEKNSETPDLYPQNLTAHKLQIKEQTEPKQFDEGLLSNGTALEELFLNLTTKNGCESDNSKFMYSNFRSNANLENKISINHTVGFDTAKESEGTSKNISQSIESSALCQSFKYDYTMVDSITDIHSPSGKTEKPSTDTWNENTCPNDFSFSTISGSIPMIASFKSDINDEVIGTTGLPDLLEESVILSDCGNKPDITDLPVDTLDGKELSKNRNDSFVTETNLKNNMNDCFIENGLEINPCVNDESSRFTSMTNSTIIENEAARLAIMMKKNTEMSLCLTESGHSVYSLDLENVKPPSHMGSMVSLTQSMSGIWDECHSDNPERDKYTLIKKSIHNSQRKKSLPQGIMMRKALNHSITNNGSLEHLDSNLEHIKPPSEMDDVLDMENSMISVASIVSEAVEIVNGNSSGVVFDLKQPVSAMHILSNGYSSINIENTNPPSLFNELTESTLEFENSINDDNCTTYLLNSNADTTQDIFQSPMSSEVRNSNIDLGIAKENSTTRKSLTPKQRRQLTKDRYKTYTIASEIGVTGEADGGMLSKSDLSNLSNNYAVENNEAQPSSNERKNRLNPKQRRQEDRARYQTQTVCTSNLYPVSEPVELLDTANKPSSDEIKPNEMKKSIKQKRIENSERYRTRTLDDQIPSDFLTSDIQANCSKFSETAISLTPIPSSNMSDYSHSELAKDATRAFECLQMQSIDDSTVDLDCETMSLVSEDDAELNSLRLRTFTKSFRNYLPVIESPTAVDICIEKNLKNLDVSSHTIIDANNLVNFDQNSEILNDCNSIECDQNSGTESADQNVYSDSDGESQLKSKPRIVKPESIKKIVITSSNGSLNLDETTPKGIRGRRKAPYVSPYKRNEVNRKSPAKIVIGAKTFKGTMNNVITKGTNISCKSSFTMKKYSNPTSKTCNIAYVKSADKLNSKGCSPSKKKTSQNGEEIQQSAPKPPTLVRQDTFTKEDSTLLCMTKVSPKPVEKRNNLNSKLVKPASVVKNSVNTSPSKLPQPPSRPNAYKSPPGKTNGESVKNAPVKSSNISIPKVSPSKLKNSTSNQSLQSNDSVKTVTLVPKSNATPKYSSNSSLNSATSSKTSVKDITSKVASLWKKVEQNKKVNLKPDVRVWITNHSKDSAEGGVKLDVTKTKLTRSSTFEGPPKITSSIPIPPKQKSSIAIKVPQSPVHKYSSKVPIVKLTSRNVAVVNPTSKCTKY
ncbi:uncharacterized protein LOC143913256 [Arctopsyche grandis]|uniref:uncharacterized protein LOC143913256 n=1 Tax=Arctopsyche grandis TaxID=121162 RepID=UPI00406D888F